jgi:hypothetical protein
MLLLRCHVARSLDSHPHPQGGPVPVAAIHAQGLAGNAPPAELMVRHLLLFSMQYVEFHFIMYLLGILYHCGDNFLFMAELLLINTYTY